MFSDYRYLMQQDLRYKSVQRTLQKLLNDGIYQYKVLKAYTILDDTFMATTDKRKLKWAKNYLRKHNVKFDEIRAHIDAAWEDDSKIYSKFAEAVTKICPGMSAFVGNYI